MLTEAILDVLGSDVDVPRGKVFLVTVSEVLPSFCYRVSYSDGLTEHNAMLVSVEENQYVVGESFPAVLVSTEQFSDDYFKIVRSVFHGFIPQVQSGQVRVMAVARVKGKKTKVVVASTSPEVNAISVCVGRSHSRIDNISKVLGERVDVVSYASSTEGLIRNALEPADVLEVVLNDSKDKAVVVVPAHQVGTAVGSSGVNISLVKALTGFKIRIVSQ